MNRYIIKFALFVVFLNLTNLLKASHVVEVSEAELLDYLEEFKEEAAHWNFNPLYPQSHGLEISSDKENANLPDSSLFDGAKSSNDIEESSSNHQEARDELSKARILSYDTGTPAAFRGDKSTDVQPVKKNKTVNSKKSFTFKNYCQKFNSNPKIILTIAGTSLVTAVVSLAYKYNKPFKNFADKYVVIPVKSAYIRAKLSMKSLKSNIS